MLNPNLTKPQGEAAAESQRLTVPGMAHFASTGPEGKTCRECAFWGSMTGGYKRDADGHLKKRRCAQFPMLAGGNRGPGLRHDLPACRYFRPGERVQPVEKVK